MDVLQALSSNQLTHSYRKQDLLTFREHQGSSPVYYWSVLLLVFLGCLRSMYCAQCCLGLACQFLIPHLAYLIAYQNISLEYRVYLSHLVRYSTACSNYQFLLNRRLYLSSKLVMSKSFLQMFLHHEQVDHYYIILFLQLRMLCMEQEKLKLTQYTIGCHQWSRNSLSFGST